MTFGPHGFRCAMLSSQVIGKPYDDSELDLRLRSQGNQNVLQIIQKDRSEQGNEAYASLYSEPLSADGGLCRHLLGKCPGSTHPDYAYSRSSVVR